MSGKADGSSSSQSASLLKTCISKAQPNHGRSDVILPIPIQLLCPAHNLFLIPHTSLRRRLLLTLEREIRMLHPHRPLRTRYPDPKVRIIQHLYREVDRLRSEVHNESFTLKLAALISVHLNARSAAIDLLSNNTTLGEDITDFIELSIQRNRSHIDGGIDALFLRLLLPIALHDYTYPL